MPQPDQRTKRREHPDDCRGGDPDDSTFAGENDSTSEKPDAGDDLRPTNSGVPKQIRMLVRTPAGFPRNCRSRPTIPPHKMAVPKRSQNAEASGSSGSKLDGIGFRKALLEALPLN